MLTLPEGLLAKIHPKSTPAESLRLWAEAYRQRTGKVADAVECHPSEVDRWANLGLDLLPSAACRPGYVRVWRAS